VINALAGVQPLAGRRASPVLRQLEHLQRWFVGAGLLRGDYVVERNLQTSRRGGEKVVIHVGDDRQLVTCFQFAQGRNRIREGGQFGSDSGNERVWDSVGLNSRRWPKPRTTDCRTSR